MSETKVAEPNDSDTLVDKLAEQMKQAWSISSYQEARAELLAHISEKDARIDSLISIRNAQAKQNAELRAEIASLREGINYPCGHSVDRETLKQRCMVCMAFAYETESAALREGDAK